MFLTNYITVARQQVKASEARCIHCGEAFSNKNVFTREGMAEIAISGMCEVCFDELFANLEEEFDGYDDSSYEAPAF